MCKVTNLLNSVEIEDLDASEETVYNDLSKRMSKADALQIIINNVEGDHSQLSDVLAEIAEIQEENNEILNQK